MRNKMKFMFTLVGLQLFVSVGIVIISAVLIAILYPQDALSTPMPTIYTFSSIIFYTLLFAIPTEDVFIEVTKWDIEYKVFFVGLEIFTASVTMNLSGALWAVIVSNLTS